MNVQLLLKARLAFLMIWGLFLFSFPLKAQNGLNFDGIDDNVVAGSLPISGNMSRTVEAWIRTSYIGQQCIIVDIGQMATGQRFGFNVLAGKLRIEIEGGGISTVDTVADGNWHHVAATYDNSAATKYNLYIDGVNAASGNITQAMNTPAASNFFIGMKVNISKYFIGDIDEVRVWNYARSASQILADLNESYCSPQAGLIAYYKMNQGIAGGYNAGLANVIDYSGNGNNGIMNGFALNGPSSNWAIGSNVIPPVNANNTVSATACSAYLSPSGNYTWTTSGTYQDTILNAAGCKTAIVTILTVLSPSFDSLTVNACSSYTSPSGNHIWTNSGSYQDTLFGAALNGCDSILNIQLTINQATSGIVSYSACDSMTSPSGNYVWDSTGQYLDTLTNVNGCDSFLTVFLTVNHSFAITYAVDACDQYTWPVNGQTYTTSGTYVEVLQTPSGCDSVITLSLGLLSTPIVTISRTGNTLTANSSVPFGSFQWYDCWQTLSPIPGETNSTFTPNSPSNYACAVTVFFCSGISSCISFFPVGIEEVEVDPIKISPNPSNGRFFVEISDFDGTESQMELIDVFGKKVFESKLFQAKSEFDLKFLGGGTYFLRFSNAEKVNVKKILILD